jgi:phage/plasmid-associated DNA primase
MSTGRTFIDEDVSLKDLDTVCKVFKDVLNEDDVINCVLSSFCLALRGTPQHKFWMWTGEGANGKSKVASFFRKTSGDYGFNLPVTVVTSKRIENGKPMPEMDRARNTRLATISEP